MNLALFLVFSAFGAAAFLTLDWFYTAAIYRSEASNGKAANCGVHDPVREHALKPNCASTEHWGRDSYDFFTNSLGFRDERTREVPLTDARPRILMLGNSSTEGMSAWRDSYLGKVAARFPQYDFLNGGVAGYSPSNYLNTARMVLVSGFDIDEIIVFLGVSDVQDEAAYYRDIDASGAAAGPKRIRWPSSLYSKVRILIERYFLLTNDTFGCFEQFLVGCGCYHVPRVSHQFDMERLAWTYRRVDETDPFPLGYAPLGAEGGLAKAKAKMNLLWQELQERNIPISVVVYPSAPQLLHDTADSRQVRIWREWCQGKCKRFISLFPAFFAVKDQCPRLQPGCWYLSYFVFGDAHYNAAGDALVADAVIKSLAEDPPVKLGKPEN